MLHPVRWVVVPKKPPEQIPEGYFDRPVRQESVEQESQVSPLNQEIGKREVERFLFSRR